MGGGLLLLFRGCARLSLAEGKTSPRKALSSPQCRWLREERRERAMVIRPCWTITVVALALALPCGSLSLQPVLALCGQNRVQERASMEEGSVLCSK